MFAGLRRRSIWRFKNHAPPHRRGRRHDPRRHERSNQARRPAGRGLGQRQRARHVKSPAILAGMDLGWLGNLTKPFGSLLNPLAERVGNWLGRRKPRLYVHPVPAQSIWCIARQAGASSTPNEMMQITFWADLNHDDEKSALVITDAYPEGTKSQIGMVGRLTIPPHTIVHSQIAAFVQPIKGERGRAFETKFVLVDQFHLKHRTQKIVFRWVGPQQPTAPVL
jgi:hypothetical protein